MLKPLHALFQGLGRQVRCLLLRALRRQAKVVQQRLRLILQGKLQLRSYELEPMHAFATGRLPLRGGFGLLLCLPRFT